MKEIVRLLLPYGRVVRVLRGPARGLRFIVQPGIGLSFALGTRSAAPRFFSKWIHAGKTVYDVGSNKGQMSLIFSALVGLSGRVYAFEPVAEEYEQLCENLRLNNIENVRTYRAAAGDRNGNVEFEYAANRPTQGKLVGVERSYTVPGAARFSVPMVTLDSMLAVARPPDVIKIDVEGGAAAVLRGARRIIREHSPAIFIELHGPEEQEAVKNELIACGFVAHTIFGEAVPDPAAGWHSPLWCHRPAG